MTREELLELINGAIAKYFEEHRQADPGAAEVEVLQARTTKDFNIESALRDLHVLYTPIAGGYIMTEKGSVLNSNKPNAPWVKLSPEMENFAIAFGEYVKSGGKVVPKLLQENTDPSGGYVYAI